MTIYKAFVEAAAEAERKLADLAAVSKRREAERAARLAALLDLDPEVEVDLLGDSKQPPKPSPASSDRGGLV